MTEPTLATDVIPLSEQFDNHDAYRPEPTDALAGRRLALHMKDGSVIDVRFDSEAQLTWSSDVEQLWGLSGTDDYEAIELRPDLYLVVIGRLEERTSLLAVLDLAHARAILNLTRLVDDGDGVREVTTFGQAGVGGPIGERFERTHELVGRRVHHRYSDTHAFEHIYLSHRTYAYQGLEGPEAGIADVDYTDAYKLADRLYLFSWHERAQPFNGAITLDLEAGRATGRLFGWEKETGRALQIRTGSIATLLNETTYEGL
ncbi:molybdenum cofactor biosynthesis F family protein [Capillimicrobium parvum]|uniref:Protein MoaF n=1 Tax=Capillimicrobium parvum TaxID=2884022 RepID=A0A9E7C1D9_9ACTN|nr:molybdenum cofactor biosynthesis F family protein [Capillimicrobium parvum]UGS37306.1 Protein MoaF [Capillimicrobium parvum]